VAGPRLLTKFFYSVPRAELFAALYIVGCLNGLAVQMALSVRQLGWSGAILATFQISAIIWVACFAGIHFLLHDKDSRVRSPDFALAAGFLLLVMLPLVQLSWLAVTALSLYILFFTNSGPWIRRGAIVLLAATIPVFWGSLLLDLFSTRLLEFEASLVSWVLGTPRVGNMVRFADNSGMLTVNTGCSSVVNISLAFLCWITVTQWARHQWSAQDVVWCTLVCGSAVLLNVVRLSIVGLSYNHYATIHSTQLGDTITNVMLLGWTVLISVLSVRHELFASA
jgi:hypothetical protein